MSGAPSSTAGKTSRRYRPLFYLPRVHLSEPLPPACARTVTAIGVAESYDPEADTAALRARPEDFELLRNSYRLRDEAPEGKID